MDTLQQQVSTLNNKVDVLYQILDTLDAKVSEALSEQSSTKVKAGDRAALAASHAKSSSYNNSSRLDFVMEHKDVLADRNSFDMDASGRGEKPLSSEIQIQRLTAQLTAAYNRIAALEEQLLSHRFH